MPAKAVEILIDREKRFVTPGALRGSELSTIASAAGTAQVLLEVEGDVHIPLAPDDIVFVRGGEAFSIGASHHADDNPLLGKPVGFTLNDQPTPTHHHPPHAKLTGAQLKVLAGGGDVELWTDLDGIADVLVQDHERIVVREVDHFFTVPREDHVYDVTVLLDGEARKRRFPSRITVRQAIRRSLPRGDRPEVDNFGMVDVNLGPASLPHDLTLHDAGVRDGHTLSITKKNGGGGHQ